MRTYCPCARAHIARREFVVAPLYRWRAYTIQSCWTRIGLRMLKGLFPVLEFQEKFIGGSCYLDGICRTDPSYPIMVGRDRYGRGFLTIRYRCIEDWVFDGVVHAATPDAVHFLTLFQRYIDACVWCKVDRPSHAQAAPLLHGTQTALDDDQLRLFAANIFRMNANEPISYMDYENKWAQLPTVQRIVRCVLDGLID